MQILSFLYGPESKTNFELNLGADSLTLDWIDVRTDGNDKIRYIFSEPLSNNRYIGENLSLRKLEYMN